MNNWQIFKSRWLAVLLLLVWTLPGFGQKNSRPDIVVIMADDMGYSDIGCYGSEISTPNLDKLASQGKRFNQFYNTGRCCPTRASLLTGQYPHKTGMGWMTGFDMETPGYRGDLNNQCVTIGEALKPAGYATYVTGKWHVSTNTRDDGPKHNWPLQRGFDKYYGTIPGSNSYFTPKGLTAGNNIVTAPKDFYLTDALTDTASQYIRQHAAKKAKDPFFLYVAYTAPHWPLHAKEKDIQKYMKVYEAGWDKLREARYQKQLKLGILDKTAPLSPRDPEVPAWKDIPEQDRARWVKRMAIYAAQVDCLDQGIGKILQTLQQQNLADNTLVMFLSDNGGCSEFLSRTDTTLAALGTDASYESYRVNWANLSNTPFRLFKSRAHEGGIRAPFIVRYPGQVSQPGSIEKTAVHLIDLMPTFLQLAGARYPTQFKGQTIPPLPGLSLLPLFKGRELPERPLFWEHEANRAVRVKDWKLVSQSTQVAPFIGQWELYDLATDKTETRNLAAKYPEKVKEMAALWDQWAQANDVLPVNGMDMEQRGKVVKRKYK